ncbi:MAG: BON domain-containing protein [Pseudosphingobacterium sp.]|nr:BON domain-containing protein [Olivibacter sp. UJ_SKK_5.1]MDX3917405.1 BON domain-containing protein [Pseudosphingobacterium sp.]
MKSDVEIQQDVIDELKWEPILDASEIGVTVKGGVVTLSGTVSTYSKKMAAERAARRVQGVTALAEDIEVVFFA